MSLNTECNLSLFSFLFSQIIQTFQKNSENATEFDLKMKRLGSSIGIRIHRLLSTRTNSKYLKREIRLIGSLNYIHNSIYKFAFGKIPDSLERSNDNPNHYMIVDNDPIPTKYIPTTSKSQIISFNTLVSSMIESILGAMDFPSKVTVHPQPSRQFPMRTIFMICPSEKVIRREEALSNFNKQ